MTNDALALAVYAIPCAVAAILWGRLQLAYRRLQESEGAHGGRDGRGITVIELAPLKSMGSDFDRDGRFDLFVGGDRAGYAMTPGQVKTEIVEALDIEMRRLAGFAPPSR